MLYVLIDKLPADILSYISKRYLPSKRCATCYCEIKWNSLASTNLNVVAFSLHLTLFSYAFLKI